LLCDCCSLQEEVNQLKNLLGTFLRAIDQQFSKSGLRTGQTNSFSNATHSIDALDPITKATTVANVVIPEHNDGSTLLLHQGPKATVQLDLPCDEVAPQKLSPLALAMNNHNGQKPALSAAPEPQKQDSVKQHAPLGPVQKISVADVVLQLRATGTAAQVLVSACNCSVVCMQASSEQAIDCGNLFAYPPHHLLQIKLASSR